ncbi:hypothetical protein [Streptomyces achromogenes]
MACIQDPAASRHLNQAQKAGEAAERAAAQAAAIRTDHESADQSQTASR